MSSNEPIDILIGFFGFIILILLCALVYAAVEEFHYEPIRADAAQEHCRALGYDNYDHYKAHPFSTEPKGITCEFVEKRMHDINLNEGG